MDREVHVSHNLVFGRTFVRRCFEAAKCEYEDGHEVRDPRKLFAYENSIIMGFFSF